MVRSAKAGLAGALVLAVAAAGCKPGPEASKFERVRNLLVSKSQDDRAAGAELAQTVDGHKYRAQLIPLLIDRLDPKKEPNPWASIFAAGALETVTRMDFGSERRSHERWRQWWYNEVGEKLPKQKKDDKTFLEKARAERKNEEGEFQLAGNAVVEALNLFREAISLDGKKALYHSNLGLALLRLGHHEEAEARFEDAIAVDKNFISAYLNKGTVYADLSEKWRAAAARMEAAVAAHTAARNEAEAKKAQEGLDRAMARINELDEKALDTYRHAIAVKGDELWAAHYLIGKVHKRRGEFEKAVSSLEKALELSVNAATARGMNVVGHNLSQIGIRSDMAITYYALDQHYSSWLQIQAIKRLGGDMPEDFVKKVEQKVKEMEKDLDS